MAFIATEGRRQPSLHDRPSQLLADNAGAKGKDIGIVMSFSHARRVFVATKGTASAEDLVGSDGTADASPANDDAKVALTADDRISDGGGEIGVVARLLVESAKVHALVARFGKAFFSSAL